MPSPGAKALLSMPDSRAPRSIFEQMKQCDGLLLPQRSPNQDISDFGAKAYAYSHHQ
jgi:hypothetical protein